MNALSTIRYHDEYTVAVDVDGPLYDLVGALRRHIHSTTGRPLQDMPEPALYNIEKAWRLGDGDLVRYLIDGVQAGTIFWEGDAYQPGIAGVRALKEAGCRVVLVTARDLPGVADLCREATLHWVLNPGLGLAQYVDDVFVTSAKTDVTWDFLVDDYEKNVRAANTARRHAALLNLPWNHVVNMVQHSWEDMPSLVEAARSGMCISQCCLNADPRSGMSAVRV